MTDNGEWHGGKWQMTDKEGWYTMNDDRQLSYLVVILVFVLPKFVLREWVAISPPSIEHIFYKYNW